MAYLGFALLCLVIVPGSFSHRNIHKYMSLEEIEQVFHTDYKSVPKYEIVKVHLSRGSHKRDISTERSMHLKAFGENIHLWLHPGESILFGQGTRVYNARYSPNKPGGVEYRRWNVLMRTLGQIYEDPKRLASFVIGTEYSGKTRINGFIESKGMAIRSMPSRIAEEYRRSRRSIGDFDDLDSSYHFVFKTIESEIEYYSLSPVNETTLQQRSSDLPSVYPDTLYPEILVVIEHSMYRAYRSDMYALMEYLLAFWNGVDLKYRSIQSPKVRFHISGIVLSQDPHATPYISENSLGSNVFNSSKAIRTVGKFYHSVIDTFPLDSYDIVVTLTRQEFGIDRSAGVLGMAWEGQACNHGGESRANMYSVSLVKDDGAFYGVHVAAHELGHLLGAPHDWIRDGCNYTDGFIMTFTPWYTSNSSDFSPCSLRGIDNYLRRNKLDCLFNRPKTGLKSLSKFMPGRVVKLEEQCKARNMGAPCEIAIHDVCMDIYCLNEDDICVRSGIPAVDGTRCDDNDKFCLHMQCVSL